MSMMDIGQPFLEAQPLATRPPPALRIFAIVAYLSIYFMPKQRPVSCAPGRKSNQPVASLLDVEFLAAVCDNLLVTSRSHAPASAGVSGVSCCPAMPPRMRFAV